MKKIIIKPKDLYNISPLLKGVMDLAFDESCIMDKDGYILHCSNSSPLIWGRPNEESIGMHITELDSASPYPELLETGKAVMGKIHIINGKTCITHMIPLFDRDNNILGAFGVIIFRGIEKLKNLVKENVFDDYSMSLYHQLSRAEANYSFDDFLTQDPKMKKIIYYTKKAAKYDYPILITGETGCGKEILASGIHTFSTQAERRPFVRINCNSIPAELLESELFGYEKGAFVGAYSTKFGKFEIAGNGTILLDEIGSLEPAIQAKLLRVIEEREFERVGGNTLIPLKARIIASTNCNIRQKMKEGLFRQDLYYRLSTFEINIPPLRERLGDIDLLVQHFLSQVERPCTITPDAVEWLKHYSWPGNVRQLRNLITKLTIMEESDVITLEMIREHLDEEPDTDEEQALREAYNVKEARDDLEKSLLIRALEENKYNISAAARTLNISRNTLYNRMKRYGMDVSKGFH